VVDRGSIDRKRQFQLPSPIASLPVEFSRERSEAKKVSRGIRKYFEETDGRFEAQSREVSGWMRVSEARLGIAVPQPIKRRQLPPRLRESAGAVAERSKAGRAPSNARPLEAG
jgi:hypothetical protein